MQMFFNNNEEFYIKESNTLEQLLFENVEENEKTEFIISTKDSENDVLNESLNEIDFTHLSRKRYREKKKIKKTFFEDDEVINSNEDFVKIFQNSM